jgi:hypothetical protein
MDLRKILGEWEHDPCPMASFCIDGVEPVLLPETVLLFICHNRSVPSKSVSWLEGLVLRKAA